MTNKIDPEAENMLNEYDRNNYAIREADDFHTSPTVMAMKEKRERLRRRILVGLTIANLVSKE